MKGTEVLIANAFYALLEEKPLSKITVREIVERCGVNRNTFYYHFRDIPALLERIIKSRADQVVREHGRLESIPDCIEVILQFCRSDRQAILHIYRSVQREVFLDHLERLMLYSVEEFVTTAARDLPIPPEDRDLLVRFYKCALIGIALDWLNAGMNYDLLARADRVCDLFAGSTQRAFLKSAGVLPADPVI